MCGHYWNLLRRRPSKCVGSVLAAGKQRGMLTIGAMGMLISVLFSGGVGDEVVP